MQDPKLDYKNYKTINNKNAREKVLEMIIGQHLVDPFRDAYPELKKVHMEKKATFSTSKTRFLFNF